MRCGSAVSAVAKRVVRAPRGSQLSTHGWPQEAAFRMIQNNLDPDVAERPDELIVYGDEVGVEGQAGLPGGRGGHRRDRHGFLARADFASIITCWKTGEPLRPLV